MTNQYDKEKYATLRVYRNTLEQLKDTQVTFHWKPMKNLIDKIDALILMQIEKNKNI